MTQEYNINNFELYRLKDITPVGGITYYSNAYSNIYRKCNGYNIICDNQMNSNNYTRIRKFDKDWNLISTYYNTETGMGKITDILYSNGFYYTLSYSEYNYVKKFNEDFTTSIQTFSNITGGSANIIYYKGYYFILSDYQIVGVDSIAPIKILRYDAGINGEFTTNNLKVYQNNTDFDSQLTDMKTVTFNNTILNYKTGQWITLNCNSTNTIIYVSVFNLDNLINEPVYNSEKPYLERVLKTTTGEIPYCFITRMTMYNGLYFLYESNTPYIQGQSYIKRIHVYDFNWNKISEYEINNSYINNIRLNCCYGDEILVMKNPYVVPISEQPIKIYKII